MSQSAPAMFVADTRGLDFLNSVATVGAGTVDWISDGRGLIEWLRQSGLVAADALDDMAARTGPGELDQAAERARNLRDWFRAFVTAHMGRPLSAAALAELEPLNRLLARDEAYRQLVPQAGADGRPALEWVRHWRAPDMLLIPLGEALARTVAEEDFTQVKACQGAGCTLVFADHTRGHARRWCSMSICGNRAKVAAHRSRKRAV